MNSDLIFVLGVCALLVGVFGIVGVGFSSEAWTRRRSKPPQVPVDRVPKYKVVCVDGFWFAFVYREYCDLWAEPFVGKIWQWWQWQHPFETEDQARQKGEQMLREARAELAKDEAFAQLRTG